MPIRRGEEYLESLRDGRRVWLMGQRVEDVTTHAALAGCARSVAAVYDLQHDLAHQDLLTMPSPSTGQPVSLSYLLPQSVDDLTRQRRMYEFLVRRAGGVAARLPQHLATVVLGLYDVRDLLGTADPVFTDHVTHYFTYCRENDCSIATIFSNPLHHRSHPTSAQEPLRVVAAASRWHHRAGGQGSGDAGALRQRAVLPDGAAAQSDAGGERVLRDAGECSGHSRHLPRAVSIPQHGRPPRQPCLG